METKHKTLAECKDEVARTKKFNSNRKCKDWDEFLDTCDIPYEGQDGYKIEAACDEAAELYASEENIKKDEPKPFGYVLGADFYAYDSTLISESEKQKSTIVHASQSNGSYSRNQENDKLVSLEVEEEARIFCEQLDEELGEAWSNDYDELPKHMAEFAAKWQSQQPVYIQWLSEAEIFEKCPVINCNAAHVEAKRNGAIWMQEYLRSRVKSIDPVEFAEWIRTEKFTPMTMNNGQYWDQHNQLHRLYGYRKTTSELLQIYINSKTKEHE